MGGVEVPFTCSAVVFVDHPFSPLITDSRVLTLQFSFDDVDGKDFPDTKPTKTTQSKIQARKNGVLGTHGFGAAMVFWFSVPVHELYSVHGPTVGSSHVVRPRKKRKTS